jgi:hypothetical protein
MRAAGNESSCNLSRAVVEIWHYRVARRIVYESCDSSCDRGQVTQDSRTSRGTPNESHCVGGKGDLHVVYMHPIASTSLHPHETIGSDRSTRREKFRSRCDQLQCKGRLFPLHHPRPITTLLFSVYDIIILARSLLEESCCDLTATNASWILNEITSAFHNGREGPRANAHRATPQPSSPPYIKISSQTRICPATWLYQRPPSSFRSSRICRTSRRSRCRSKRQ